MPTVGSPFHLRDILTSNPNVMQDKKQQEHVRSEAEILAEVSFPFLVKL
jgi:hypothetical protein